MDPAGARGRQRGARDVAAGGAIRPPVAPASAAPNRPSAAASAGARVRSAVSPSSIERRTSLPSASARRARAAADDQPGPDSPRRSMSHPSSNEVTPASWVRRRACSRATAEQLPTSARTGPCAAGVVRASADGGRRPSAAGRWRARPSDPTHTIAVRSTTAAQPCRDRRPCRHRRRSPARSRAAAHRGAQSRRAARTRRASLAGPPCLSSPRRARPRSIRAARRSPERGRRERCGPSRGTPARRSRPLAAPLRRRREGWRRLPRRRCRARSSRSSCIRCAYRSGMPHASRRTRDRRLPRAAASGCRYPRRRSPTRAPLRRRTRTSAGPHRERDSGVRSAGEVVGDDRHFAHFRRAPGPARDATRGDATTR